ncbi:hypothetical protein BDV29DRAFT_164248 [Aspergillus leporis]|jgi:hypothetical protein|uniref:DUF7726 domain-containing protein n=1 Tax=Aspergillus leporis TaxID=41062 RepID=A0A5N5XJN8_9EURO|nr:hypothetical protein BDV29DRAFT_164248 [Aspergillus leporis]
MAAHRAALEEINHHVQNLQAAVDFTKPPLPADVPILDLTTTTENATPTTNNKRKTPPMTLMEIVEDDPRLDNYKWDCGQIRRKIRSLINSKEMKACDFQREIDTSSRAYYDFLKQSGRMAGAGSNVYHNAHRFFMMRELQGIKRPRKPKTPGTKTAKSVDEKAYDVSGIHLPGEEEGEVEVYDHCDEVRKKIVAFLRSSGMTQAAFCREISKSFPENLGTKISGAVLANFLNKRGVNAGNQSTAFYAAYVFFEKLRIRDGKPKTQFREEMEEVWGVQGGFDRKTGPNQSYITSIHSYVYSDEYGRVRTARM